MGKEVALEITRDDWKSNSREALFFLHFANLLYMSVKFLTKKSSKILAGNEVFNCRLVHRNEALQKSHQTLHLKCIHQPAVLAIAKELPLHLQFCLLKLVFKCSLRLLECFA